MIKFADECVIQAAIEASDFVRPAIEETDIHDLPVFCLFPTCRQGMVSWTLVHARRAVKSTIGIMRPIALLGEWLYIRLPKPDTVRPEYAICSGRISATPGDTAAMSQ